MPNTISWRRLSGTLTEEVIRKFFKSLCDASFLGSYNSGVCYWRPFVRPIPFWDPLSVGE